MRRSAGWFARSLVVLALVAGSACSGQDEAPRPGTVGARELPAIYTDILAQRDRVHAAISKGAEMWHEECAEVSAGASQLETLLTELQIRVAQDPDFGDRVRGIDSHVGLTLGVVTALRDNAVQEVVGMLPGSMIQLDAFLRGLESHFSPDQLGGQSVTTRPGFNPDPPPAPPSPV